MSNHEVTDPTNAKNKQKNTFTLTIDPRYHQIKPPKWAMADISDGCKDRIIFTIKEFAYFIGKRGLTFSPAQFNGTRSAKNFKQSQFLALDFDNKGDNAITPDQVLERLAEYGIIPNVIYYTLSSKEEHLKFRVCLLLDTIITDRVEYENVLKSLLNLFPEADKGCKDASRMFLGGKESKIISEQPVEYQKLYDTLNIASIKNSPNIGRSTFSSEMLKNVTPYSYIKSYKNSQPISIQKGALDEVAKSIRILSDFIQGEKLHHNELFGIATNLIHIKGGVKWMKNNMLAFNERNKGIVHDGKPLQYGVEKFDMLRYVNKMKYFPMQLENFSQYQEDHQYRNIVSLLSSPRGQVERITTPEALTLEAATVALIHALNQAIESDDKDIHFIKTVTGLGKTRCITSQDKNQLIANPTHDLKDECLERMNGNAVASPRLPKFSDQVRNQIDSFYRVGANGKAAEIIHKVASNKFNSYSNGDQKLATRYLHEVKESSRTDCTILTTHQKLLRQNWSQDTLIFDECPLGAILNVKSVKMTDLFIASCSNDDAKILLEYFQKQSVNQYMEMPAFNINMDRLIEIVADRNLESNLIDLLQATHFIKQKGADGKYGDVIQYITRVDLPIDKKVVILSATAPVEIYKLLYGDRVKVTDLSHVEKEGTIVQYTNRSYSRSSLIENREEIVKATSDKPVITFSSFKGFFKNPVKDMHFGNCEGYDSLNGLDIAIVGTPHMPEHVYFLYAMAAGIKLSSVDNLMARRAVEWKGLRFAFPTYENPQLRDIQLSLIESELIQAVGRNRTTRKKATAEVYSNLPLYITDEFIKEKLK